MGWRKRLGSCAAAAWISCARGIPNEAERLLSCMDDIYATLVTMDYPGRGYQRTAPAD